MPENAGGILRKVPNRHRKSCEGQILSATPHVWRHTYCSDIACSGMNSTTLPYLMGRSDTGIMMNIYTHLSLEDAQEEMMRLQCIETKKGRAEVERLNHSARKVTQAVFKAK